MSHASPASPASPASHASQMTATGHVIGWTYHSQEHGMSYVVVERATIWDLAPEAAARVRWANGNETVTTRAADDDRVVSTGTLAA
jgi:hypothetical protein